MINPSEINGCIFLHEDELYQFNYNNEEDDEEISFYNWTTAEHINESIDIVPLLHTLTSLGLKALLK